MKPWTLSVPIARDHWVTLVSNRPMTTEAFAAFDRYLALQKEAAAEDEAQGIETQRAETEGLGPKDESPVTK